MAKVTENYGADQIEVLEGLEPVRRRPGMYIGSTGTKGLNHLIYEIVDNSVDEHLAGYCTDIHVTLNKDGSCTVQDNGRGIPTDLHAKKNMPAVRVVLTTLHAGGKFGDGAYKTSGGLHGVGSSAVNALSTWMDVEVSQKGQIFHDRYEKGIPQIKLAKGELLPVIGKTKSTGTKISFLPDPTIFEKTRFREADIKSRLHEITYLNPGLTIYFKDEREDAQEPKEITFHEEGGLTKFIKDLNAGTTALHEPIYFHGTSDEIEVECAMQYTDDFHENIMGFCNTIYNSEGGTHLTGFKTALTSTLNQYARAIGTLKEKDENFSGADVRNGLTAIVSIKHRDPRFEGQTKTKLDNQDAAKAVAKVTNEQLVLYFDRNLETLKTVLGSAEKAAKIRKQEEKSKENLLTKKRFSFDSNGKLANCESRDASKCEIFIVEGDSAGGSAKMARNRKYQAILPIRGKILNVEKASMDKIMANEEIRTMIYAFDCGFSEGYGKDFDISKLRYNKIIAMCFTGDTAVKSLDGNTYTFKELVENGTKSLWVYSMDSHGNVVPGLATDIRQIRTTNQLVKITLDNGQHFTCTPDHMMLMSDGSYKMASELVPQDSLMPLNVSEDADGYIQYYDRLTQKHIRVHRMVERELFQADDLSKMHVHHIDGNKHNNVPENLECLTPSEHARKHGTFTEYNTTDAHRNLVKQAHANGVYRHTYFGNNGYNESNQHSELLKKAWRNGVYANRQSYFKIYNQSETHRETVGRTTKTPNHIISVARSKILKSVAYLIANGIPFDEHHYNLYRMHGTPSYDEIGHYFGSIAEVMQNAMSRDWDLSQYVPCFEGVKYDNAQKQRQQIANVINIMLTNGVDITEETYNRTKGSRTVAYKDIQKWFDSYDEAIEFARHFNHKVKSVEVIEVDNEPVYCMTVDKYHNFLLGAGVFAKNCDADVDGRHIDTLLLTFFYRMMPELIREGHVYTATPPLYKVIPNKGDAEYLYDDEALEKYRKKHKDNTFKLQRYKGLGEMDPEQLWETTMNPATRWLKRVTIEDAAAAAEMTSVLMGNDVVTRKQFIYDNAETAQLDW